MQNTANYQLKKPEGTDIVNIQDFNDNADIIDTALANKVEKISGKQLSTNDYTTAEKNKLAGMEAGAQVNAVTSVAGKTGAVTLSGTDVPAATTSARGTVQLNNTLTSTSTTNALTAAQGKILKDLVETKVNSIDFTAFNQAITQHMNNTNNPHNVTKEDVELGSVQNYGLATQAEATAGTSNAKYMTPLRTKETVTALAPSMDEFNALDTRALKKLAVYVDGQIDPNTTLEAVILTGHYNRPVDFGSFAYIITIFYGDVSTTNNRMQVAFTYNSGGGVMTRYYSGGSWTAWGGLGNTAQLSTSNKTSVVAAINELFQSVSSGKALVANAITGKGVTTSPTAEFATMASNIGKIATGKNFASGSYTNPTNRTQVVNLGFNPGLVITAGSNINGDWTTFKFSSSSGAVPTSWVRNNGWYTWNGTSHNKLPYENYEISFGTNSVTIQGGLAGTVKWWAYELV